MLTLFCGPSSLGSKTRTAGNGGPMCCGRECLLKVILKKYCPKFLPVGLISGQLKPQNLTSNSLSLVKKSLYSKSDWSKEKTYRLKICNPVRVNECRGGRCECSRRSTHTRHLTISREVRVNKSVYPNRDRYRMIN